jgi:homospermidine synthase
MQGSSTTGDADADDLDAARAALEESRRIWPGNAAACCKLADLELHHGSHERAVLLYEEVSALPPCTSSSRGRQEAAWYLEYVVKARAQAVGVASYMLALLLHLTGRCAEAVPHLQRLGVRLRLSPQVWAAIAQRLGIKVIHIAERDTQVSDASKQPGEFVNTWSIDGFVGEGNQPAELGWGTHEKALPEDGREHVFGCGAAIWLNRRGAATRVRSWTPLEGPFHGFLITHNEAISIADYYTLQDGGTVRYRPTVHYAYHPCDDAVLSLHELAGKNWSMQAQQRLMMREITSGIDELGVLLMGHARGAYWYGSRLSIEQARALAPHNNATSLQVTAAVLGGMVWAIENPQAGVVEADQLDHARVLEVAGPYLGDVVGAYSSWTPLVDRGGLFTEQLDNACPWQFANFRVA